jgi:ArsR family transcriptional regulator
MIVDTLAETSKIGRDIEDCQYTSMAKTKLQAPGCYSLLGSPIRATEASELAKAFHALADPVRLQLLSLIAVRDAGEVCACALVEPVGKSQPTVSHHLKVLYGAGLVDREKRGTWVWYWIVPERVESLRAALAPGALIEA